MHIYIYDVVIVMMQFWAREPDSNEIVTLDLRIGTDIKDHI